MPSVAWFFHLLFEGFCFFHLFFLSCDRKHLASVWLLVTNATIWGENSPLRSTWLIYNEYSAPASKADEEFLFCKCHLPFLLFANWRWVVKVLLSPLCAPSVLRPFGTTAIIKNSSLRASLNDSQVPIPHHGKPRIARAVCVPAGLPRGIAHELFLASLIPLYATRAGKRGLGLYLHWSRRYNFQFG